MATILKRHSIIPVLVVLAACWISVNSLFALSDFDFLTRTDSRAYWMASQHLATFPPLELPGYPLLVLGLTSLFPWIAPVTCMQFVSFVSFLISAFFLYQILVYHDIAYPWKGVLLFGLFPLVGVTLSIYPRVNALIYCLLFVGIFAYVNHRVSGYWVSLVLAANLFTHKSVWPVIIILVLVGLYQKRLNVIQGIIVFCPLLIYWGMGAAFHGDWNWLLESSISVKFTENELSGFTPFAGLWFSLVASTTSTAQLLRFAMILLPIGLAIVLLVSQIWRDQLWLLSLIVPVLLWAIILNEQELWSIVDYSLYLVIPLMFFLNSKAPQLLRTNFVFWFVLITCLISQFAFSYYSIFIFHTQ